MLPSVPGTLLEPVTAGQTRFRMHGLQPDARGIAVGRELLLTFASIDWLVSFLGAYSDEASLDDLLPTMTLEHARREGGGHAILLRCAAGDGYAVDRLARLAVATRGQLYSGGGSVFVRWRERDAPFGYDLVEVIAPNPNEVSVVDTDHVVSYETLDRMDPVDLIQRLQLRAIPLSLSGAGQDLELSGLKDIALVLVAPGLAERVLGYLWRNEVPMGGYYVQLEKDRRASLLLRLRAPRRRVLRGVARNTGGRAARSRVVARRRLSSVTVTRSSSPRRRAVCPERRCFCSVAELAGWNASMGRLGSSKDDIL